MTICKLSRFLQPRITVPPGKERGTEIVSNSQKLLDTLGLVRCSNGGTTTLLPLALRVLNKLKKVITEEIEKVGAMEIMLPALTPCRLLKQTGRDSLPELFKLKDRHDKEFVLSPTHEEAVVNLIASLKPTYKQLPLYLFQTTSKFRDEMKPRFGLMRSKEFLMKDLYCFDPSPELSKKSYETVNDSYEKIFKKLQVPYLKVVGNSGEIGGNLSHEFHILSNVGEDCVRKCNDCEYAENSEKATNNLCSKCNGGNVTESTAIEVGHSFLLGTRYTKPLEAKFIDCNNETNYLEMSCHGVGISRLLAACVESLSKPNEIRWPTAIAPFQLCIIIPKTGSKEEKTTIPISSLIEKLSEICGDDIVLDDRTELTIGKRFTEAKQIGYPFIVIIGKAILDTVPKIEFYETLAEKTLLIEPNNLADFVAQKVKQY